MIYDMWKFDDSMNMIKQTYVTSSAWNGKTKVDEGCRASLVRIDVKGYPDPCVIAFGYRKWYAGGGTWPVIGNIYSPLVHTIIMAETIQQLH